MSGRPVVGHGFVFAFKNDVLLGRQRMVSKSALEVLILFLLFGSKVQDRGQSFPFLSDADRAFSAFFSGMGRGNLFSVSGRGRWV